MKRFVVDIEDINKLDAVEVEIFGTVLKGYLYSVTPVMSSYIEEPNCVADTEPRLKRLDPPIQEIHITFRVTGLVSASLSSDPEPDLVLEDRP